MGIVSVKFGSGRCAKRTSIQLDLNAVGFPRQTHDITRTISSKLTTTLHSKLPDAKVPMLSLFAHTVVPSRSQVLPSVAKTAGPVTRMLLIQPRRNAGTATKFGSMLSLQANVTEKRTAVSPMLTIIVAQASTNTSEFSIAAKNRFFLTFCI